MEDPMLNEIEKLIADHCLLDLRRRMEAAVPPERRAAVVLRAVVQLAGETLELVETHFAARDTLPPELPQ